MTTNKKPPFSGPGPDLLGAAGAARLLQAPGLRPEEPLRHGQVPEVRRQRHPLLVSKKILY